MDTTTLSDPETQAILNRLTHGTPVDAELAARLRLRRQQIREEILKQHGVLDIGVSAIRELRGPLPE